jgi:hypothetical protein
MFSKKKKRPGAGRFLKCLRARMERGLPSGFGPDD